MALTALGVTSFNQIGPARWDTDAWGLDRVVIPYDGYITGLETFLGSKPQWSACPIDGNMFLSTHTNNGDKRYPKIDLIYIGKRGGTLPPARRSTADTLQTISYEVGYSIGFTGGEATLSIEVQYLAPVATVSWIANTPNAGASPSAPVGSPRIIFWRVGALSSVRSTGVTIQDIQNLVHNIFSTTIIPSSNSEEIVPGRYYQNSASNTLIYTR